MKKRTIKKRKIKYDAMDIDYTFLEWIIPRLKYFEKHTISYPPDLKFEEWIEIVREMRIQFEDYYLNGNLDVCKEALNTFMKYFEHLWM